MEKKKYVYLFSEGDGSMRNLLGGKGANLAEMTRIGIPVPQGFIVTTEACNKYYEDNKIVENYLINEELKNRLKELAQFISKIGYIGAILVFFSYLFKVIVINNNFDIQLIKDTITNFPLITGYIFL